jgi:hypothetical protein
MFDSIICDWLEAPAHPPPPDPLRVVSGSMWALYPSHEQPTKLIVSLPTFSGRAHLPTHALHCYVQENKRRTELDLEAGGVGVSFQLLQ